MSWLSSGPSSVSMSSSTSVAALAAASARPHIIRQRSRSRSPSPAPSSPKLLDRIKRIGQSRQLKNYNYKDSFLGQPPRRGKSSNRSKETLKERERRRRERKIELEHLRFKPEHGRIWQMVSRRRRHWQSNERWKRTKTLVHKLEKNIEDYFNTEVSVLVVSEHLKVF